MSHELLCIEYLLNYTHMVDLIWFNTMDRLTSKSLEGFVFTTSDDLKTDLYVYCSTTGRVVIQNSHVRVGNLQCIRQQNKTHDEG